MRRQGKRLRITAQLIDAVGGGHHWAERYDRELGDIFAVQDEITRSVAAVIEPRLLAAEGVRALVPLGRRPRRLGARGPRSNAPLAHEQADFEAAIGGLERAVESLSRVCPRPQPAGVFASVRVHMGWLDRAQELRRGHEHALAATALDDHDPWGHIALGYWALMERRTEESIAAFRRAVDLNPNSAAAHGHLGHGLAFAGRDREAIRHAEEAIRLSPFDPMMAFFLGAIAVTHYLAGRYAESRPIRDRSPTLAPWVSTAHNGCGARAWPGQAASRRRERFSLRCGPSSRSSRSSWISASVPYQTPEFMERFLEGMNKAGLNGD